MSYLGVADAAEKLGVSARRIRQLIDAGSLRASRVGKVWVVDDESVQDRSRSRSHSGRPFSFENAWRLALLAEGGAGRDFGEKELSASELWRARRALRELLESADLSAIDAKLRARCDRVEHRFAHPSVVESLAADKELMVSGQRAAAMLGGDLVSDRRIEAYIHERSLEGVDKGYGLQQSDARGANVLLRVLERSDAGWQKHVAPRLFVAADLSRSLDARAWRAAGKMLESVAE